MKQFIMICAVLFGTASIAYTQENKINQQFTDAAGQAILIGQCTREALWREPFRNWFVSNYDQYIVDSGTCVFVAPLLKDKKITLFMGTWCGDSRREVPRLLKILDCCGFPPENLTMIMVSNQPDMYKKSPGHEEEGRQIIRVPTMIIEGVTVELGRIIEFPVVSLEKDLLRILRKDGYVPNYAERMGLAVSSR
jgi:hypothetical protein